MAVVPTIKITMNGCLIGGWCATCDPANSLEFKTATPTFPTKNVLSNQTMLNNVFGEVCS
jgi:hypothetical protein